MNTMETPINTTPDTEIKTESMQAEAVQAPMQSADTPLVETTPAVEETVMASPADAIPAPETVEMPSQEVNLLEVDNILDLEEVQYPQFTLAKNKARFLRMLSWYRSKREWLDVAPMSGLTKLFKSQTKELEGIRANKLDYEMELETGTLTPSQRSYKKDELKMCRVQEKMAVQLITKMQIKIKSGRR